MISKSAVHDFLNKQLDDTSKWKALSAAQVEHRLRRLEPQFEFHTRPWLNQKVCFLLGCKYGHHLFLMDMGTGKTKVTLDLCRYFIQQNQVKRMLVLVRNTPLVEGWLDEIEIHAPQLLAVGLCAGMKNRWEALESAQVVITTYAGALRMVCDTSGGKWVTQARLIDRLAEKFDILAMDESSELRNHNSLRSRVCRKLSTRMKYRFALTGTPFGTDPADLWMQFFLVDHGETLGSTLGIFREAYFSQVFNPFSRFPTWKFNVKHRRELYRRLRHRSIYYEDRECTELPPVVHRVQRVIFPDDTYAMYKREVEAYRKADGDVMTLGSIYQHMRQLASGFLMLRDSAGKRSVVTFSSNPKLDALEGRVYEIDPARKFIVFCEYRHSTQAVVERLEQLGIKAIRMVSGVKQKGGMVRTFREDPSIRALVATTASGSFGLNLQFANYVLFYEVPSSPIIRKQAIKRCDRPGQERHVFITDFVVKGSIEERVLTAVNAGEDLFDAIVKGKVSL